ncbi:hypothetical protein, partial [Paraburkholderia sp. BR13444]|uniref:hypothetical protein n=1 Tax=Paraburkholderia sp. BR13444 TaxID=3236997 RepID=UPI0034CDFBAA
RFTEGFNRFVTSTIAPVASGWSGCRVGLSPTGKRRLFTAHAMRRHLLTRSRRRSKVGSSQEPAVALARVGMLPVGAIEPAWGYNITRKRLSSPRSVNCGKV